MFALASSVAFFLAAPLANAQPEDWPCWRGPRGDNVSLETDWRVEGRELWRAQVGIGHSSCAVAAGRVYTLGFVESESADHLWCLDAETGKVLWTQSWPAELMALFHSGGTLTTPAVADGRVWCSNRSGVLRAFDAEIGDPLHAIDLRERHDVHPTDWGFGGSHLLIDGRVLVNASRTLALDPESGETIWASDDRLAMYSTPTALEHSGRPRLAVFAKQGLVLLDRADGKELAFHAWRRGDSTVNASSPVVIDDRIFISSAYDHGCAMLRITDEGFEVIFESKVMRNRLSGCVLFEDHLYGFDESMLKCIDLEGKEAWRKRGLGMGALTLAAGRLILASEKGELVLAAASPKGFEELTRTRLFETGPLWASPVLCEGRVFVRSSQGELQCRNHR
jgi:outer membrane protein assembly factor BamB